MTCTWAVPQHPAGPDLHMLLVSIPTGSKFFAVVDGQSTFFRILLNEASQSPVGFCLGGKTISPGQQRLGGFTESPSYFPQVLKADMDYVKFLRGSTVLQDIHDLFLCSPSQAFSKEDSTHLLRLLALRGHKVTKRSCSLSKVRFSTWVT